MCPGDGGDEDVEQDHTDQLLRPDADVGGEQHQSDRQWEAVDQGA
jgi:hypothetical protein